MDEAIINFLDSQTVATICCSDEVGKPYCFPCFYCFNPEQGLLYIKTSPTAYHSQLFLQRSEVAGSVLPDKLNKLALKGIQWEGVVLSRENPLAEKAGKFYYRKYPFALVIPGEVYAIELTAIKLIDGAKGFGKKIMWRKAEAEAN